MMATVAEGTVNDGGLQSLCVLQQRFFLFPEQLLR